MTNLIDTYFILQYVYYNPLHVSSIICSSSGGLIVLVQHLISSLLVTDKFTDKYVYSNNVQQDATLHSLQI